MIPIVVVLLLMYIRSPGAKLFDRRFNASVKFDPNRYVVNVRNLTISNLRRKDGTPLCIEHDMLHFSLDEYAARGNHDRYASPRCTNIDDCHTEETTTVTGTTAVGEPSEICCLEAVWEGIKVSCQKFNLAKNNLDGWWITIWFGIPNSEHRFGTALAYLYDDAHTCESHQSAVFDSRKGFNPDIDRTDPVPIGACTRATSNACEFLDYVIDISSIEPPEREKYSILDQTGDM